MKNVPASTVASSKWDPPARTRTGRVLSAAEFHPKPSTKQNYFLQPDHKDTRGKNLHQNPKREGLN